MISYEEYLDNRTNIGYLTAEPKLDDTIQVSGSGSCYELQSDFGTSNFDFEYDYYTDELKITVEKELDEDERENEWDDTEIVELDEWDYEGLFEKLKGELYYNSEIFDECENFVPISQDDITSERVEDPNYLTVAGEFKVGSMHFDFRTQNSYAPLISFRNGKGEDCPAPFFITDSIDLCKGIEMEYEAHDIGYIAERDGDTVKVDFSIGSNLKQDFQCICQIQPTPTVEIRALEDGEFADFGSVDINIFKSDVVDEIWDAIEQLAPEVTRSEIYFNEPEKNNFPLSDILGDAEIQHTLQKAYGIEKDEIEKGGDDR